LLASLSPAPSMPRFPPVEAARVPSTGAMGPLFQTGFIPQPTHLEESYSPALARLASGDLICFFYAGSSEGAPDVCIYRSVFRGSSWSEPRVAVTPRMLGDRTGRFVRKIGNPAVFAAESGQLHLFVTCVTLGGWSGARIVHLMSHDEGNTWAGCETLKLSPFLNMSNSCRAGPVGLADGGFYLPAYHEMIRCYPEVVRFDREGRFLGKIRLNDRDGLLQPTLMPVSTEEAFVHFRNKGTRDQATYYQSTRDGGASWSEVRASNFSAPNSSLVTARLDADLYVRVGAAPTTDLFDCRPYRSGSDEVCELTLTDPAVVHVMVRGFAETSTYSLTGGAR